MSPVPPTNTLRFFSKSQACASGVAVALVLALSACASGPNADPRDPLEPLNRKVSAANYLLDKGIVQPLARGYNAVTPSPVRDGVTNFFKNLREVWSIPNSVLQFKMKDAIESSMRVAVNTVFGFGGLLDLGTAIKLERHSEDFGETLGAWGVPPGPYVVLPLLGSSTLRDTAALPMDSSASLKGSLAEATVSPQNVTRLRNTLATLELVDKRVEILPVTDYAEKNAFDLYTFTRDAFLQRRRNDVYDGDPPAEDESKETD